MSLKLSTLWPAPPARRAAAALGTAAAGLFALAVARQGEWMGVVEARLARGKKPRLEDFILEGQWQAAVVSAALCLVLALTARYWTAAPEPRPAAATPVPRFRCRWFWPVLLVIVAGAAWLRAPRLSLSLYNDEAYAFRRYVAGEHKLMPDGSRQWRPVSWRATLWGNQMANNGVPYSLVSRVAYDWAVGSGRAAATLPAEVPLRLPALAAGLGSLVVIALLARRLGGPAAGPAAGAAAALLAAAHPWHVRYSTEARGHSFVLLLAPLLPLALARAVETGKWRWWALFGTAEVLLLWSFAGSVYYVFALNFLALIWLWRQGGGRWRPFLAVHTMAAMVYLHLMAPCFPQIRAALAENGVFSTGLGSSWWSTTGSFLFAGMPWANANPEIASHPSLRGLFADHPAVVALLAAAALGVVAAGARRAWAAPSGRLLVLTLPLAAVLAVTATLVSGTVLFTWYVLYLLPGVLVLAGLGLAAVAEWGRRRGRRGAWASGAAAAVLLAGWGLVITRPLQTYRKMSKQAFREVVRFLRAPVDGVIPLAAVLRSEAGVYDPSLRGIDGDPARGLQALAAQADAEGRPLLVAFGYRTLMVKDSPEFLRAIEDSGEFERVAHFPGLEEAQFAHHVWRRRPQAPPAP